jgi:hypothetical protein
VSLTEAFHHIGHRPVVLIRHALTISRTSRSEGFFIARRGFSTSEGNPRERQVRTDSPLEESGFGDDPIVVVLTENVSDAHLEGLRELQAEDGPATEHSRASRLV